MKAKNLVSLELRIYFLFIFMQLLLTAYLVSNKAYA